MSQSSSGLGSSNSEEEEEEEDDEDEDEDAEMIAVPHSPSSKALVPFTPRSVAEDHTLQELVNFCKFNVRFSHCRTYLTISDGIVLKETVTSPGPRKEWFPFTVTNPAFFHAVIGSTASLLAYAKRAEADNVEYFYHRGQAISLVNKAISNGEAATEDVFATVACFIQQDVSHITSWRNGF
jgi:hypothetical protein